MCISVCVCMRVCARLYVRLFVRVFVRVFMCKCVCACVCALSGLTFSHSSYTQGLRILEEWGYRARQARLRWVPSLWTSPTTCLSGWTRHWRAQTSLSVTFPFWRTPTRVNRWLRRRDCSIRRAVPPRPLHGLRRGRLPTHARCCRRHPGRRSQGARTVGQAACRRQTTSPQRARKEAPEERRGRRTQMLGRWRRGR